MSTATHQIERMDLRRRRAMSLASAIMNKLEPYINDDAYRGAYDALAELLGQEGVEVLTDHDRQAHGLPPRGPDGWTTDELIALERRRLELMTRPLSFTVPTSPLI